MQGVPEINNTYIYYIIDAFTSTPFGGNPAGVVLANGIFPDVKVMSQIAAELRYSETAFVLRHSEREYSVRFFTPCAEVNMCGHATIAAFSLLKYRNIVSGECLCHTLAGDVIIDCGDSVMIQMVTPQILNEVDDGEIYRAIGLNHYKPSLPTKIVSTGLPDIMVQVPDVKTLNSLNVDMAYVSNLLEKYNAVSIHVFTIANDDYTAHVRNFSPLYGIPEEAATGTSNASLTYYLKMGNVISGLGDFFFIQGEAMGRPSIISTRINNNNTVFVGGQAVIVAEGKLFV